MGTRTVITIDSPVGPLTFDVSPSRDDVGSDLFHCSSITQQGVNLRIEYDLGPSVRLLNLVTVLVDSPIVIYEMPELPNRKVGRQNVVLEDSDAISGVSGTVRSVLQSGIVETDGEPDTEFFRIRLSATVVVNQQAIDAGSRAGQV